MAEKVLGLDFEVHGGGSGPGVPAPRERDRPDRGGARRTARPHLDAQRHDPLRRGEDGEVGGQRRDARRRARPPRARRADRVLPRGALPAAARLLGRAHGGRAPGAAALDRLRPPRAALGRACHRRAAELPGAALREEFSPRCATTSTPPEALAALFKLVSEGTAGWAAARRCRGGGRLRRDAGRARPRGPPGAPEEIDEEALRLLGSARTRGWRATTAAPTRPGTSSGARLGGARHARGAGAGPGRSDPLRAQRRPGGAPRAPPGAPVWAAGRALAPRPWRRVPRSRSSAPPPSSSACAAPRHQGLVCEAEPIPTPTPARCWTGDALVVALDQVQDPQNLGAVSRSAECAGATGVVIPERRAAEVTPAVCRASAGRRGAPRGRPRAQPRRLPREAKQAGAWVYGADGRRGRAYTDVDWSGRVVLVLGSEGAGCGRACARPATTSSRCPSAGRVGSLNVSPPRRPCSCTRLQGIVQAMDAGALDKST